MGNSIAGTWKLVSFEVRNEDGEVSLKYHLYDEAVLLQEKATYLWTTHTEGGRAPRKQRN